MIIFYISQLPSISQEWFCIRNEHIYLSFQRTLIPFDFDFLFSSNFKKRKVDGPSYSVENWLFWANILKQLLLVLWGFRLVWGVPMTEKRGTTLENMIFRFLGHLEPKRYRQFLDICSWKKFWPYIYIYSLLDLEVLTCSWHDLFMTCS